jgi:nucleotide-binding universal stress UspA family protein
MDPTSGPIVVGLDASMDSQRGLAWAMSEAVLRSAPLHLVHALVWPMVEVPPTSRQWTRLRDSAGRLLSNARADAQRGGVSAVSIEVASQPAAAALLKVSRWAQLVVVGARGHGAAYDLWLGSVSQHLTRFAHCPVVVARAPADPGQPRIVAGVDDSPGGALALRWALAEAETRSTSLTLVHGWRDHAAATFGTASPVWGQTADRIEAGERLLRSVLDEHGADYPEVKVDLEAVPVHPARVLADASAHAALVVVGAGGNGRPGEPRLGSIGQSVLHHAQCPVAVVR